MTRLIDPRMEDLVARLEKVGAEIASIEAAAEIFMGEWDETQSEDGRTVMAYEIAHWARLCGKGVNTALKDLRGEA